MAKLVESEEQAIIEGLEPPRRMCYDLLYVYLVFGFFLILLQIVNQFVGNVLREYALALTIGILIFLLLYSLYFVRTNPPIRLSEVVQSHSNS